MTKLSQIEVQSYTLCLTANYQDDDGEEYEIVFTKTYEDNLGYEEREVVNIEKDGNVVDLDNPIWEEIEKAVKQLTREETEPYRKRFTIEVEQSWLDALQGMADAILQQPTHTPEGALEFSIFAQIQKQLPATGYEEISNGRPC